MTTARIVFDLAAPVGPIDRRLFGSFVEHLGRGVYDGIHEPAHPSADADGFRQDVKELVRELGVTTVRYPGGNFVSGFRWEDSVGPKDDRPVRLDLAWHSRETNEVGLHEMAGWLEDVGVELMLAVNLGTRGTLEALDLLEYANIPSGTRRSDERTANGSAAPFAVRMWCLGNEMDGPWQLGHRPAAEYGKLASQTAKAMRMLDPDLQLVVCGSSYRAMPTFGEWERIVLEHTFEDVDYISCHAYYQERDGDLATFLASALDMDAFIDTVAATIDHVKAITRSDREVFISFDEWNVWYYTRYETVDQVTGIENWPIAPRLLEDLYTVADAVVVGSLLISLLRHADRVRSACLAQLVNVIAPIMTEPGGPAWRQTTFYPFATTARLAQGVVLRTRVDAPVVGADTPTPAPMVDAVVTHDEHSGACTAFAINRSMTESVDVVIDIPEGWALHEGSAEALWDDDPYAANTLEQTDRITLRPLTVTVSGRTATVTLPPVSWSAVSLALVPEDSTPRV